MKNYSVSINVNASPEEVYQCINNVKGWWTENLEGRSRELGDVFTVRFGDVHASTQELVELIPGKKIVWLVTDSQLSFIKDKQEWTNTRICFDITTGDQGTKLVFTQEGLVPGVECFDACSNAWGQYIQQSLNNLINTGKGNPAPKEEE